MVATSIAQILPYIYGNDNTKSHSFNFLSTLFSTFFADAYPPASIHSAMTRELPRSKSLPVEMLDHTTIGYWPLDPLGGLVGDPSFNATLRDPMDMILADPMNMALRNPMDGSPIGISLRDPYPPMSGADTTLHPLGSGVIHLQPPHSTAAVHLPPHSTAAIHLPLHSTTVVHLPPPPSGAAAQLPSSLSNAAAAAMAESYNSLYTIPEENSQIRFSPHLDTGMGTEV